MARRTGIIGGSFDPIHIGHLIIAQDALEQFELERVLFVPAYQAPLKAMATVATPAQRLEMTRLAIRDNPRFELSEADFQRDSISYSAITARRLREQFPQDDLFWILGADQVNQLHLWRNIEQLSQFVTFISFDRPGLVHQPLGELPPAARILRARSRELGLSSTEIRERVKSGLPVKYFLPVEAFDYIKAENLYL